MTSLNGFWMVAFLFYAVVYNVYAVFIGLDVNLARHCRAG